MRDWLAKIVPFRDLSLLSDKLKSRKVKIVSTNGCFDILHWGHISYLNEAKKLGDILIVGVNSDRSVKALKGDKRPLFDENTRAKQLASLEMVDFVSIFDEDTPIQFIELLRPQIHAKGGDYSLDDLPEKKVVENLGGKMILLPYVKAFSTSNILKSLNL